MLKFEFVNRDSTCVDELKRLYVASFPENERGPIDELINADVKGVDVIAFFDGEVFVGFCVCLTNNDITHILYIATEENMRDRGYGSLVINMLNDIFPGNRIIADVEAVSEKYPNNAQRVRRMDFYIRNGYAASNVAYRWKREDYVVMVKGGTLSEDEMWVFWNTFPDENVDLSGF